MTDQSEISAACGHLYASGADFVAEGGDPKNAEKYLCIMLDYADPEYVEAYDLIKSEYGRDSALAEFKRGMGTE